MRASARVLALAAAFAVLNVTGHARAQFNVPTGTAEIQEDWIVVVANPNPSEDGPQIQTYMSPVTDSSLPYAWFMLNSRDNPYAGGGMQIQAWTYADALLGSSTWGTAKLSTANETITWTQSLSVSQAPPYALTYKVINGSSTTWGAFGPSLLSPITYASGQVQLTVMSTYDPSFSIAKSRVGWQANNVTKLGISQVRCLDKNGKVLLADTTWRPVNLTPQ